MYFLRRHSNHRAGPAAPHDARERTPRMDAGQPRSDCEDHVTFLDDEAGHGIESDERLTILLKDVGDDLWVLPALALYRTESDDSLLQRFRMWRRRRKVSKAYGMIVHAELNKRVESTPLMRTEVGTLGARWLRGADR